MPQPQPGQQSRFNDFQMLQRHIMFKQLQELQMQQQFQELGDAGQHNYINQQSMMNKQASGAQFPPLINGTPIHDASQMFMVGNMDLVQRGTSPAQGFSNGLAFSQAQSQGLHSMGLVSQPLDVSSYGTPIDSPGNNLSQYSHLKGKSHDSSNMLTRGNNNRAEKPVRQSSVVPKSFMSNQCNDSSNQDGMLDGAFVSKQVNQEKNLFGEVPTQAGWPRLFPGKTTNIVPSQGLDSLDPLEQKILFNMDDNSWEASFCGRINMGTGGLEHTDHLSAFTSLQSGSWSALMQSAVAEATSNDTGVQEEWSGLSYQNPDLSTDNQPSNFVDSENQHTSWADDNLQSVSSKPELLFNNSSSSGFSGFQQSGIEISFKQKDGLHMDTTHESFQQSPKNRSKWLDCNLQEKQFIEGGQPIQRLPPLQSAWPGQNCDHSESGAHQQRMPLYTSSTQPCNILSGDISEAAYKDPDSMWKTDNNHVVGSFYDYVKHVDVFVKDRNVGKGQDQLSNNSQNMVSHFKGASETHERRENCFQRENSVDSHHSNSSHHTMTGHELRENICLHESDPRPVAEGKQKLSDQVGQNAFTYSRVLSHHARGQSEVNTEHAENMKHVMPKHVGSSVSSFFDRPTGFHSPNATAETSHYMLELLHKVNKSTEYRPGMRFGSRDSTSSEVPQAETPDASVSQSCIKSSDSHCFGLRLSPPSQWLSKDSSQSSPQTGNSTATFPAGPNARNQLQSQHKTASPFARQSPEAILPDMRCRFSDFNPASSWEASTLNCTNPHDRQFPILGANSVTQPSLTSGTCQNVVFSTSPTNVWTNVPAQKNLSGIEPRKAPFSLLPSPDSAGTSLETSPEAPLELHDQTYSRGGSNSRDNDANTMNSQCFVYGGEQLREKKPGQQVSAEITDPVPHTSKLSHRQESSAKNLSEANAVTPGTLISRTLQRSFDREGRTDNSAPEVSARDFEAFGHSLKPSEAAPQKYSLLHQIRSGKNETTALSRVSEKGNAVDSDSTDHQGTAFGGQQSPYEDNSRGRNLVNGELHFSNREEQSQISLQMAPTWFNHYGTLKNEEIWSMHVARAAKNGTQKFSLGKPSENFLVNSSVMQVKSFDASQVNVGQSPSPKLVAVTHLAPPHSLPTNVTGQNLAVLRPNKRKIAPFELLPWHKEVTQGTRRLQSISMAELEWALAVNRLVEKVEHEAQIIEDLSSMLRPKKRLILTTQLMQQLFRPAPAVILSGDATSNCVNAAHFAARFALADACSLTSNSPMPPDISDMSSEKPKPSERVSDHGFSKFVEHVINRSKWLEGELLSYNKRASFSDVRLESQDLDKFSVINRLAKFHSRGPSGASESSTSSGPALNMPRMFLQRYVKAHPMPRTVPEGAKCLKLGSSLDLFK